MTTWWNMTIQQVEKTLIKPAQNGKDPVYFSYKDIVYEKDGWADASKYLPAECDLCSLIIEGMENPISGWIIGKCWDSARFEGLRKPNVIFWKQRREIGGPFND